MAIAEHQSTPATLSNVNLPSLSKEEKALANETRRLRLVGNVNFPMPNIAIAEMAIELRKLMPELTPEILSKIINKIIVGDIPYDPNKGILNITQGYKAYKEQRITYQLYNVETGDYSSANEDDFIDRIDKNAWYVYDVIKKGQRQTLNSSTLSNGLVKIHNQHLRVRTQYLRYCENENITPDPYAEWIKCIAEVA